MVRLLAAVARRVSQAAAVVEWSQPIRRLKLQMLTLMNGRVSCITCFLFFSDGGSTDY